MGPIGLPSAGQVAPFFVAALLLIFGSGFVLGRCTADLHPHISITLH